MAAALLAHARAGLTVVARGGEADALAPIAIGIFDRLLSCVGAERAWPAVDREITSDRICRAPAGARSGPAHGRDAAIAAIKRWGIKTLGEFAALPAADVVARLGRARLTRQAVAPGRPLIPALGADRFGSSLDLECQIEELEPLSFVLTRLLEPLAVRLERRDRGAAVLHVVLRLGTPALRARRLAPS